MLLKFKRVTKLLMVLSRISNNSKEQKNRRRLAVNVHLIIIMTFGSETVK